MATRLEAAKKILLYWMDGSIALLAVVYAASAILDATAGTISAWHTAVILVVLFAFVWLFRFLRRAAFEYRPGPTRLLLINGALALALLLLMPHDGDPSAMWVDSGVLWLAMAALYLRPLTMVWLSAAVVTVV